MFRHAALLFIAFPVAAQAPLVTDRPDQTESAVIVPRGALQIEVGALSERLTVPGGTQNVQVIGASLLRYGIHPRLEARLGFDGLQRAGTEGAGDLEAGFKLGLVSGDGPFDLALMAGTTLPTGADPFSSGRLDPRGRLAFAIPLTDRFGLGANAGVFTTSGAGDTRADALYSAVVGAGLTDRVAVFAESFGTLPISSGGLAQHSLDGGITVLVMPLVQLDASAGVGLSDGAPDWFVGGGVSVRIGR